MNIYRLEWYLASPEDRVISKLLPTKEIAQRKYAELQESVENEWSKVSWTYVQELFVNKYGEYEDGEIVCSFEK